VSITRNDLQQFLNALLTPDAFVDYGPNGLQIEGTERISKIAFAVSATANSARIAANAEAQALVVHHGLFWKFHGPRTLTGPFAYRIFPLVQNGINLFAYHLPLDAHPVVGNAAQLGARIGLQDFQPFGDHQGCSTGIKGTFAEPLRAADLRHRLSSVLAHPVLLASPDETAIIHAVGIITGGANQEWTQAMRDGLDAYITGEMSEHDWHEAQEAGIHMFAGGHNATEQFGVQALMAEIKEHFEVDCFFIPSDNPA